MIGGNHDYIHPDSYPRNPATEQTLKGGSPEKRKLKLERFKNNWNLEALSYSEMLGGYPRQRMCWRNRVQPAVIKFRDDLKGEA